jgi:hypothetical protein
MNTRRVIEELVPEISRNACVVRIDERDESYRVTIAGTTGVEARCEVPRDTADAAPVDDEARARLAAMLKSCADRTVAEVPDARG